MNNHSWDMRQTTRKDRYSRARRGIAWILGVVFFLAPLSVAAEIRSGGTLSGMVRVYLSSISSYQSLDITIAGSYSIGGDTSRTFSRGDRITVSCQSGGLTLSQGGNRQSMGSSFKLRRHATSGENGVRIAQARNASNLYPGDIEFKAKNGNVQVIVHVYIEDYMRGVLPYEMSNAFPLEALKAQAVAARTYTLKKMSAGASDYDVVDTTSDQTYRGTPSGNGNCVSAVTETQGIVGLYDGTYMASYYTASNGGQTESVKNAWNSNSYPYLQVKDDPYDLRNSASNVKKATVYKSGSMSEALDTLLRNRAAAVLAQSGYLDGSENVTIRGVENVEALAPQFAAPSRLYTKVAFSLLVTATKRDGEREAIQTPLVIVLDYFSELESLLSLSLNSTKNELISIEETPDAFQIAARRYGHGIGMSQRGAQQMAREGMSYEQILDFYYPGTTRVAYTFTRSMLPALDGSSGGENDGDDETSGSEEGEAVVSLQNPLDTLNLRKERSTSSAILAQIPHGTQLRVLEKETEWCRVQYGALSGYVMCSYLQFSDPETPVPEATPAPSPSPTPEKPSGERCIVSIQSGKLNLRAQPNTHSAVLALLSNGTALTLHGTAENGWLRVAYGGLIGYVAPQYVRVDAQPENTVAPTTVPDVSQEPPADDGEATDQAVVVLSSELQTLNLRLLPTTASSVLARIRHGSSVRVLARYSAWSYVLYGDLSGYVMNAYLYFPGNFQQPEDPDATPAEPTATPVPTPSPVPQETAAPSPEPDEFLLATVRLSNPSSSLNVRAQPGATGARLGQIHHGTQVRVLSYDAQWCGIDYAGTTGYVATRYLVMDTATPVPTQGAETGAATPAPETTIVPAQQCVTQVEIRVKKYLNVRAQPRGDARIIGRVRTGTRHTVTDTPDGFYEIAYEAGKGYISAAYAEPVAWGDASPRPEPTPTPVQIPADDSAGVSDKTPAPEQTLQPTPTPEMPDASGSDGGAENPDGGAVTSPSAPTASPAQVINTGTVRDACMLYEACGNESTALMELNAGESVRVLDYPQAGWGRVETQGVTGYVRLESLRLAHEAVELSSLSEAYHVYEAASYDAQAVGTLRSGQTVTVVDVDGEWASIRTQEVKGYILAQALELQD